MPDEYISREAMLEHLDRCKQSEDATTLTAAVITALQCFVQSQPTADVVQVRNGRWIHTDLAAHWLGKDECSECTYHEKDRSDLSHNNYCPNCGAKMDGATE